MLNSSKFISDEHMAILEASLRHLIQHSRTDQVRFLSHTPCQGTKDIRDSHNEALHRTVRDCLLLLVAINTGARASELLLLRKDNVTLDQSILIRALKGSNDRTIPLPLWLYQEILDYSLSIPGNEIENPRLFNISYQRLVQIWKQYRPIRKCFHSIRHTRAVSLYKKSRNIHLVKYVLGHRSIVNSMVYLDYIESQEELRSILM